MMFNVLQLTSSFVCLVVCVHVYKLDKETLEGKLMPVVVVESVALMLSSRRRSGSV